MDYKSHHMVSACMGASQTHQAMGAKVNDPGGFTMSMTHGGSIPGNTPGSSLG